MNMNGSSHTNDVHGGSNNPYVKISPTPASDKRPVDRFLDTLNRYGKKMEEFSRKAEVLADGVRNHLKLSPSMTEAAMARLNQGTKVLREGKERVFEHQFGVFNGEKLLDSFVCYVSTINGPLMGTLYISNKRITFCSDYPLSYQESAYYKVMVQLEEIKSINQSANRAKPWERYIHLVLRDGYEFWFMGFVSYDKAFKCLNKTLS